MPRLSTGHIANATQVGAEADLADADNADAADFMIDDEDGTLKFNIDAAQDGSKPGSPDFENGQGSGTGNNTYKVVVVACDVALAGDPAACPDTGEAGYHKVTVMVTDVVEAGKIEVAVTVAGNDLQFRSGATLTAEVSDGDISGATKEITTGLIMRWYRGSTLIDEDTDNNLTYTVVPADVGHSIRLVATYRVGSNQNQDTASWTSAYPVIAERIGANKLKFDPDMLERSVAEGDKGMMVGAPVRATGNHGAVVYSLPAGNDNAKFKIDERTGQITTMEDLNREHTAADADPNFGCGANYECVVRVRATDATSATVTTGDPTATPATFSDATVTVKLTNVDEKPEFLTDTTGTPPAASPTSIMSAEKRTALFPTGTPATTVNDVTYAATDPEGLNVNLMLMGPDGAKFSLNSAGVLSFRMAPDYEMPGDADGDNTYEVTVRASDGTMTEDRMVMVMVTDVDEAPVIMATYGTDASLTSLSLTDNNDMDVELMPAFASDTTEYTAMVGSDVEYVMVEAMASRGREIDGDGMHTLMDGDNTITVTVSAGEAEMTYTVVVTREAMSAEARLLRRYDGDGDNEINDAELGNAIFDNSVNGTLSDDDLGRVIFLWVQAQS